MTANPIVLTKCVPTWVGVNLPIGVVLTAPPEVAERLIAGGYAQSVEIDWDDDEPEPEPEQEEIVEPEPEPEPEWVDDLDDDDDEEADGTDES